jgi:hypothetical protein
LEKALKTPDFFVIGAPKCGTTSLASWLGAHPKICMSSYKEPHYFNTDDKRVVDSLDHYLGLFSNCRDEHLAVGEASVWYLSSTEAVSNILAFCPNAKFIVLIRNPLEMAQALHSEMLFVGNENIESFEDAWIAQKERKEGQRIPSLCWESRWLQYGENCKLGAQVQRLLAMASSECVLVLALDDMRQNARSTYLQVLNFLNVPDDGRMDFAAKNTAKVRRMRGLTMISNAAVRIKHTLGIRHGFGVWRHIDQWNQTPISRSKLKPEFANELREYFGKDVALLGQLVGRNLGAAWKI